MILTMLSSGDRATAQAAADAERYGHPLIVNPYQVLQVRRDATPSEIRNSYRRLSLWHHPGRSCGAASSAERARRLQVFEILAASYETLVDRETRSRIDVLLREKYADLRRSRNIPAGKVCVGGKPLSSQHQQPSAERDPDNFIARVIGHLSVRQRADEEEGDCMNGPTISVPKVEPVSSDSSFVGDHAYGDEADLDSECPSQGSNHAAPSSTSTPRIHMPLGSPLGTPTRALRAGNASEDSSPVVVTKGTQAANPSHHQKQHQGFFGCGMEALRTSFDSQVITALANSSSSDDGRKGREVHYTEGETNRLFGGPLQLLYQARRWKPFRDPFEVFSEVFGSEVQLGTKPEAPESPAHALSQDSLILPAHSSAGWTGSSETLKDGTVLFHTCRILHNRRMTRTEAVRTDPITGQKHSKVTVTSEILNEEPDENQGDEQRDDFLWPICRGRLCGDMSPQSGNSEDAAKDNMFCGTSLAWC